MTNAILTAYLIGAFPDWFPLSYTVKAVVLISFRWLYYYIQNYHWFLLDCMCLAPSLLVFCNFLVCYFANLLCLLYLYYAPENLSLFFVIFAFANGPLLWVHI